MRKILITLLLASAAATPALADPDFDGPHSGGRWQQAHQDQNQAREEHRQARSQGPEVHNTPNNAPAPVNVSGGPANDGGHVRSFSGGSPQMGMQGDVSGRPANDDGHVRSFGGGGPEMGMQGDHSPALRAPGWRVRELDQDTGAPVAERHVQQDSPGRPTNWRMHERQAGGVPTFQGSPDAGDHDRTVSGRTIEWRRVHGDSGSLVQPDKPLPRVLRNRIPVVSNTPREGTQPPPRTDAMRQRTTVTWNTDWRHDHRYDWWGWRRTHHSFFHLGFYYDPFGWGYQPYEIGWRLWPAYYGSRYWISDPWDYRLPYAPPGYRWIRYYDDLLLVDTWDGEVVDVIRDFFW